jgi:hypothetical protein
MTGEGSSGRMSRYRRWRSATDASNFAWPANIVFALFAGYLIADQGTVAKILGMGSPELWKTLLLVGGLLLATVFAMQVASSTARRHTGILDVEDPVAFVRLGGFDIGRVPMLIVQLGVFGIYWLTWEESSDPLGYARRPSVFLLISTLLGLIATWVIAEQHFRRHARSAGAPRRVFRTPRMGARVTSLSADRLELSHPKRLLQVLGAAFCFSGTVSIYLNVGNWTSSRGTTHWIAFAYVTLLGCACLLVARTRRVVFNKRAGYLETSDRFVWRRVAVKRLPLHEVSAIVVSRSTMGPSQLTNIVARIGGSTVPIVVGSRLAANARKLALTVGRFLDVPVYEDEQLLAVSADLSVSDVLDMVEDVKRKGPRRIDS